MSLANHTKTNIASSEFMSWVHSFLAAQGQKCWFSLKRAYYTNWYKLKLGIQLLKSTEQTWGLGTWIWSSKEKNNLCNLRTPCEYFILPMVPNCLKKVILLKDWILLKRAYRYNYLVVKGSFYLWPAPAAGVKRESGGEREKENRMGEETILAFFLAFFASPFLVYAFNPGP